MGMWDELGKKKVTPFDKSKTPTESQAQSDKPVDPNEPTLRQRALYDRKDYGIFGNKKSKEDPRSKK